MSELRKEIERQFRAHGLLSDAENKDFSPETKAAAITENAAQAETVVAPPAYPEEFASDFKNLPEKWQAFLCERETENKNKITECTAKLDAYGVLETLFGNRSTRLKEKGVNTITQWLQGLAWLDEAMDINPAETLGAIASVYGVDLHTARQQQAVIPPAVIARVCQLERDYRDLTSYLHETENRNFQNALNAFGRQTDGDGNLLHPYFEQVRQDICDLLNCRADCDIETAYAKALWLNPSVRKELIQKQIDSEADAAAKSKQAVFAVKGKAEQPERALTLRETIAKNMAKYVD